MTARVKGCWVAFEQDLREDDAVPLLDAIQQLRGVLAVEAGTPDTQRLDRCPTRAA